MTEGSEHTASAASRSADRCGHGALDGISVSTFGRLLEKLPELLTGIEIKLAASLSHVLPNVRLTGVITGLSDFLPTASWLGFGASISASD